MTTRFEQLLVQAQTGRGADWISQAEILEFNEFIEARGFGVARMEVKRAKGGTVRRSLFYGILPAPIGDDPEHWLNHFDPVRSAAYVREAVQYVRAGGALFDHKLWAEQPWPPRATCDVVRTCYTHIFPG
ncbi:hypothetical protein HW561_02695 [Rhodobacteraceae bacterium B1Z28]|uniref:Uncharacterized protein n=1 Tax=Ruegeria haliotis TaxID=2747601 RepID=A0ABX2PM77_9RHOB|nr:hypothetical protein [Ruegeria haliotis]NVO54697.1 hypothetical protein [Ruegeria haliotis]